MLMIILVPTNNTIIVPGLSPLLVFLHYSLHRVMFWSTLDHMCHGDLLKTVSPSDNIIVSTVCITCSDAHMMKLLSEAFLRIYPHSYIVQLILCSLEFCAHRLSPVVDQKCSWVVSVCICIDHI